MKIFSAFLFVVIFSAFAGPIETTGCNDFFKELDLNPKLQTELKSTLNFLSCVKVNRTPAILLESTYTVSGKKPKR